MPDQTKECRNALCDWATLVHSGVNKLGISVCCGEGYRAVGLQETWFTECMEGVEGRRGVVQYFSECAAVKDQTMLRQPGIYVRLMEAAYPRRCNALFKCSKVMKYSYYLEA